MEYLPIAVRVVMISGLFYGYYHIFLRDRRFHGFNRVYLLMASVVSLVLPFVKIPVYWVEAAVGAAPLSETLRVISGHFWDERGAGGHGVVDAGHVWTIGDGLWMLYAVGVVISLVLFVRALLYIREIRRRYSYERVGRIRLYDTAEKAAPFSFFRSVFWHSRIAFSSKEGQQIFRHELFHTQQGHSADVVWMELCSMICWFNPFFYMMKKELMTIHEYLADRHAISAGDPLEYAELLLVRSLDRKMVDLTSPMFYQTIKRRITMITTKGAMRSGRMGRWMAIPAALLLFVVFGFRVERGGSGGSAGYSGEPITLVVDAGHGGIDPGTEVAGIEDEKIWTLRLAKKVSDLAADYHVKVVLTRSTDILPGNAVDKMKGLENRVEIAKQAGAMAFVSLHVNNDEMGVPTKATGFEAYVSKRRMDTKSIELAGSLLQRLSPLYTTLRDVKRREEEGIYVLDHNVFPAVLLECGYMNNPSDIQFLGKEANQDAFARAILQGVVDFFAKK